MSNSDNLFNGLVGRTINEGINSSNKGNNSSAIRFFLALTGLLFFIGAEAVKVFFRKNFGVKGINLVQLILCSLCFLGIGILSVMQFLDPENTRVHISDDTSQLSFLIIGVGYITLALYILRKGILERMKAVKANNYSDFQGDADVMKILAEKGWSQNKIRYLAEPMYTLILGIVVLFYNPLGGIPLLFCALSVWGHAAMEFIFLQKPLQPDMATPQNSQHPQVQQSQQIPKSSRVSTDF